MCLICINSNSTSNVKSSQTNAMKNKKEKKRINGVTKRKRKWTKCHCTKKEMPIWCSRLNCELWLRLCNIRIQSPNILIKQLWFKYMLHSQLAAMFFMYNKVFSMNWSEFAMYYYICFRETWIHFSMWYPQLQLLSKPTYDYLIAQLFSFYWMSLTLREQLYQINLTIGL